jgi:hypothetical protein
MKKISLSKCPSEEEWDAEAATTFEDDGAYFVEDLKKTQLVLVCSASCTSSCHGCSCSLRVNIYVIYHHVGKRSRYF